MVCIPEFFKNIRLAWFDKKRKKLYFVVVFISNSGNARTPKTDELQLQKNFNDIY
jgi:hypothetical protein